MDDLEQNYCGSIRAVCLTTPYSYEDLPRQRQYILTVYIIYRHTNLLNGKSYVGLTSKSISERWIGHCHKARNGSRLHFHRAIAAYGDRCWKHEILEENIPSIRKANNAEECWILKFRTFEPELGYNMTTGGDASIMRDSSIEKIRQAHLGRKLSKSHKKAIGDGVRGLKRGPQSLEHREKLRRKRTGRVSNSAKPVVKLNLDGEELARFPSVKSALESVETNNPALIRACCNGTRASACGFRWEWL